mmetsp:Transcript_13324/g.20574  ORF Transcript_13324/g.20574 Transcript_13324/m.20574 type:complete len:430 (+) Transcript_13324:130-1419(+)|eukprot:CAMPEP_0201718382 /NCGR_PEP_ID=MMETSP0593-20130828/3903_1 /ASSEMBLY_ACC=CAM_ASM_000672 /TAXON_ID=267983 /ORGANISM="Skeletonema japonicum, Strain CCMP2506" /LENGTH=429 /DNA_ID=CAMNT_0048208669 /DNA_START=86 /DNA_END=1375 /DNA_ORIENTATION=-
MTAATAAENIVVKQPPVDTLSTSIASNPQQGMSDQRAPATGTASGPPLAPCSPLTISSALEQQQTTAANNTAAVAPDAVPAEGVPMAVVGGPFMEAPPPGVPAAAAPVSSTVERKWKRTPPTESDPRKLFVGGLPTNVNDEQFLQFFEKFGEVIDSVVMVDRNTKRSRGFGFVTFADQEVTNSLLNNIPGKTGILNIFGKSCEIKASEPKVDHDSSSTRRYPFSGSNNSGGKHMVMQQLNNQHQHVGMPNEHNRDNGYNGDERDFDAVNYRFEPNHQYQGYYNHGHGGHHHHNMMMYHHPYGYAQYQNYPPNYSSYEGPGPNYEGGEVGSAQYNNYYSPPGYYPDQQFHGHYGANPMFHGGNGEGVHPYPQSLQQQHHANYGYGDNNSHEYDGKINGGSVGSTSYEAQMYPATTSGVDGDYGQAAAGDA